MTASAPGALSGSGWEAGAAAFPELSPSCPLLSHGGVPANLGLSSETAGSVGQEEPLTDGAQAPASLLLGTSPPQDGLRSLQADI